jgi:DHA1 family multidrug resistance protein-like MFS transporter
LGLGRRIAERLAPSAMPAVYWELIFVGFAIMMGMSLPASFLPILAEGLDPSGVLVGLVVSAWFFSRIFLELPAGLISDRIGRRRLLIFGIALSCLGPILCSQANNIWLLIIGRGVWGMGTAFYFMNNTTLLMDILPSNIRGRALGLFQGIEFVGSFIGAPIGAFLSIYMSFNQVFYFTLLLTVISLVIAWRSGGMKSVEREVVRKKQPSLREVMKTLGDRGILIVCLSTTLRMLIMQGIFQTVFQLYLNLGLTFAVSAIGLILSARIAGQIISLISAGILSDKVGRIPVLFVGFVVCGVILFAFTLTNSYPLLLVLGFVEGLGEGFGLTTLIALLTDIAPPSVRGGAVGLFRTFQDIGGFAGPILFMVLYNGFGPLAAFYVAAAVNVVNVGLIMVYKSKPVQRP